MYSLLGMPQKTVETLTFEDFLKVKDRLVAQEVPLQELNNRAAGIMFEKSRVRIIPNNKLEGLKKVIYKTSLITLKTIYSLKQ
jgi:hypothetical protein